MKPTTSRRSSSLTHSFDQLNIRVPDSYSSELSSRYSKTFEKDSQDSTPSFTLTNSQFLTPESPFESLDSTICSIDSLKGRFHDVEPNSSVYKHNFGMSQCQDTDSSYEDKQLRKLRTQLKQRDEEIKRLNEESSRHKYQLRAFVMLIEELEAKVARKEQAGKKLEQSLLQKETDLSRLRRRAKQYKGSDLETGIKIFDERIQLMQKSIEEHLNSLERIYLNAIGREDFFINQMKSASRNRNHHIDMGDVLFKESADDQGRFKTHINILQEYLRSMSEGFEGLRFNSV